MFLHLSVSHSVHKGGEYLGRYPPWIGTPLGRYTPSLAGITLAGTPPAGTPHTPQVGAPPGNACWDTVNKRVVRILLECILVF